MRFTAEETAAAYQDLRTNQKPTIAFFGGLVGLVPALIIYLLFIEIGGVLAVFLALPPTVIGIFARSRGKTFRIKHRVPVGLIAAIEHVLGCYLAGFHPMIFAFD